MPAPFAKTRVWDSSRMEVAVFLRTGSKLSKRARSIGHPRAWTEPLESRQLLTVTFDPAIGVSPPPLEAGARTGRAVAASEDVVLVGAPLATVTTEDLQEHAFAGRAFVLDAATRDVIAELENPNASAADQFGSSVAILRDGQSVRYAVGAPVERAVYVFDGEILTATIRAPDASNPSDMFGSQVAAYDATHVLVAAPQAGAGTVYLFDITASAPGNSLPSTALVTIPNPSTLPFEEFGSALAVNGTSVVIGARQAAGDAGAAYGYTVTLSGASAAQPYLPQNANERYFGSAVAFTGTGHVAISAPSNVAETLTPTGGSVYLFGSSTQTAALTISNPTASPDWFIEEGFGVSLASRGDLLAIGAPFDLDSADSPTGAVYVADLNFNPQNQTLLLESLDRVANRTPTGVSQEYFGLTAAWTDLGLVVGDPDDLIDSISAGSVYFLNESVNGDLPPTDLSITPDSAIGVRDFAMEFTGSYTDIDTPNANITVTWDFGDLNDPTAGSGREVSHVYTEVGLYTVTMTVFDGTTAISQSLEIEVRAAGLDSDGNLLVGGSTSTDAIVVTPGPGGTVTAFVNGISETFSPAGNIIIRGGDGLDVIVLAGAISRPAIIFGGAGSDLIKGGNGTNVIVGGDGNDLIVGGAGRDVLIGGDGADRIVGNAADDILIAGTTSHDDDVVMLESILTLWTDAIDAQAGAAALAGYLITAGDDRTVFSDADRDLLTGSSGTDWFLYNQETSEEVLDRVTDMNSVEAQFDADLDLLNSLAT